MEEPISDRSDRSYRAILIEALAHEKAGRWSAASAAWLAATKALAEGEAKETSRRAELAGLKPGTVLVHRRYRVDRATAVYIGNGIVEYNDKRYPSLAAAASAAAADLGMRANARPNGWWFWGVEKREQSCRVTDELAEESEAA
jgi:hypothetical protein